MKTLLLAAMLALAPLASAFAQSREVVQINEQVLRPTVQILAGNAVGSGTVLYSRRDAEGQAKTLILTNWHVVRNTFRMVEEWDEEKGAMVKRREQGQIVVRVHNYHDISQLVSVTDKTATVRATDSKLDLAVIQIDDTVELFPYTARFPAESARVDQGEEVYAVGGGLGLPPFLSHAGRLGFSHMFIDGHQYTLATSSIAGGNSGGGLYRRNGDGDFELVGVPTKVARSHPHIGFSVMFRDIRAFLRARGFREMISEAPEARSGEIKAPPPATALHAGPD